MRGEKNLQQMPYLPSDALAEERLERARMEYMWTQAKNAVAKEG